MTSTFLLGSDRSQFGGMLKNLENQYSLGTNMYPTKLGDAVEAMSVHDSKRYGNNQTKKRIDNDGNQGEGSKGNNFSQTSKKKEPKRCFCCGSPDHVLPCPLMDEIAKKDWYRNSKRMWCDEVSNDDDESTEDSTQGDQRGWSTFQSINMLNTDGDISVDRDDSYLRDRWTLDSGTTATVIASLAITVVVVPL